MTERSRFIGEALERAVSRDITQCLIVGAGLDAMKAFHPAKMPPAARPAIERLMKLIEHEPWVFGIPLDSEREFLSGLGLELGENAYRIAEAFS